MEPCACTVYGVVVRLLKHSVSNPAAAIFMSNIARLFICGPFMRVH
jgi:hypothetical protein